MGSKSTGPHLQSKSFLGLLTIMFLAPNRMSGSREGRKEGEEKGGEGKEGRKEGRAEGGMERGREGENASSRHDEC